MYYVGQHVINRGDDSISPTLKLKLLNVVGKIQLMHGIYGTIVSCNGDSASNCILSVTGIGYSFLSQPIENVMVKMTHKQLIKDLVDVTSKIVPRVLSYDTKFIVQVFGAKYGAKMAKGIAGGITGVFDIIDISMASNVLIECNKRAANSNPCSDKEIRDNIAAISFAGISFIAGVVLIMAANPIVGMTVGAVILLGQGIYGGVSNIIEYEEKYDTTHGENWSIFWRTFLLQKMSEDIEHLVARDKLLNDIVQDAWNRLNENPRNVVAYAIGLGKETM